VILTILGALTGLAGPISGLAREITALQKARLEAGTEEEKKRIDAAMAEAEARRAVLVAEAGSRLNAIIRGAFAIGPLCYLLKVFVFDKVIGSFAGYSRTGSMFATDPLDDNLWKVVVAVIAFYFVYDLAARWRR
jgi:hypothetical protein